MILILLSSLIYLGIIVYQYNMIIIVLIATHIIAPTKKISVSIVPVSDICNINIILINRKYTNNNKLLNLLFNELLSHVILFTLILILLNAN